MTPAQFEKYFTLDEAVAMLPFLRASLEEAHAELRETQDDIVLYKRMHAIREEDGEDDESPESQTIRTILKGKWERFDEALHRWERTFTEKGALVRSMQKGLLDFPYLTKDGEELMLCWHYGEDGILFFHDNEEGFSGRRPITLLPD